MAADSRRRDWRDAALVALAGLVLLLIADALIQDANVAKGDDLIYELMADKPFETHSFPFAYRFLVPGTTYQGTPVYGTATPSLVLRIR